VSNSSWRLLPDLETVLSSRKPRDYLQERSIDSCLFHRGRGCLAGPAAVCASMQVSFFLLTGTLEIGASLPLATLVQLIDFRVNWLSPLNSKLSLTTWTIMSRILR